MAIQRRSSSGSARSAARSRSIPAGIHLHAPAIGGAQGPALLVAALYTAGLIIGTCWMAHSMRTRARAAHRHRHLQAWQLRQLVPR